MPSGTGGDEEPFETLLGSILVLLSTSELFTAVAVCLSRRSIRTKFFYFFFAQRRNFRNRVLLGRPALRSRRMWLGEKTFDWMLEAKREPLRVMRARTRALRSTLRSPDLWRILCNVVYEVLSLVATEARDPRRVDGVRCQARMARAHLRRCSAESAI